MVIMDRYFEFYVFQVQIEFNFFSGSSTVTRLTFCASVMLFSFSSKVIIAGVVGRLAGLVRNHRWRQAPGGGIGGGAWRQAFATAGVAAD